MEENLTNQGSKEELDPLYAAFCSFGDLITSDGLPLEKQKIYEELKKHSEWSTAERELPKETYFIGDLVDKLCNSGCIVPANYGDGSKDKVLVVDSIFFKEKKEELEKTGAFRTFIRQVATRYVWGEDDVYIKVLDKNTLINISPTINCASVSNLRETYLFNWDNTPGKGTKQLVNHLINNLEIEWVENAEIEKHNKGKTITVRSTICDENSLEIRLNENEDSVILETRSGRTHNYKVKKESNDRKIYTETGEIRYTIYNFDKEENPWSAFADRILKDVCKHEIQVKAEIAKEDLGTKIKNFFGTYNSNIKHLKIKFPGD